MGRVNENENRSKISISAESREEPINYLKDSRLEPLKFLLARVLGILILVCSETNLELNGWSILILITKAK
jgi:hypothetical protein